MSYRYKEAPPMSPLKIKLIKCGMVVCSLLFVLSCLRSLPPSWLPAAVANIISPAQVTTTRVETKTVLQTRPIGDILYLITSKFEAHPQGIAVYNLEVENHHNYFVKALGSRGPPLLAHNMCETLGQFEVGDYNTLRKNAEKGLDSHHVGQKALMKNLVKNYDPKKGPSILVDKYGHRFKKGSLGIVSRSMKGVKSARQLLARDILELRRVYSDVPNSALKKLVEMNKKMYPEFIK